MVANNSPESPAGSPNQRSQPIFPPEHGWQIFGEAVYLVLLFGAASVVVLFLHLDKIPVRPTTKIYLYAAFGGLLGGWAFDTKWFVRSCARLKNPEDQDRWEPRRIYWRIFTPFVAAIVALTVYLAGSSGAVFIKIENKTGAFSFAFCFILGYFSDAVVSKMANYLEKALD